MAEPIPVETERIAREIVDAAIEVHRALGAGLLESVYEVCLVHELASRKIRVERQTPLPVRYKRVKLDAGFRLDLRVESQVIVEIKSVEQLLPVHTAQLLTYLRLSGCRVGLLLNFNVTAMKLGIKRVVL